MQHNYSDDHLRLAARLYYIDGLAQNEVARLSKVSQAKVSRLLALARQRGIVRISVADYDPRHPQLEEQLTRKLGLGTAIVIKAIDGLGSTDLRRAVGHFSAAAVDALIKPAATIALAGGRTLHELVNHLAPSQNRAVTVVQAMGSVDSTVSAFDAQEVGRALAQRLGGSFLALNTPAYMPERRTRDVLLQLEQVRTVRSQLDRADLAFVGLGTLENSVFVERGVLGSAEVAKLRRAGTVGETCGRFFDADGRECATPWRSRVMSVELDQLRHIPQVIGVVSGDDRSAAILAATRGGILKGLVIDETGARTLLAAAGAGSRRPTSLSQSRP
ncbi:transcriptional regulator [Opitutaceae bacterium EW11]|nr:transcriptional regulator [Opitutaceae bacterium EW11]